MICPPEEATASTAPAKARFVAYALHQRNGERAGRHTTFATALPGQRAEERTGNNGDDLCRTATRQRRRPRNLSQSRPFRVFEEGAKNNKDGDNRGGHIQRRAEYSFGAKKQIADDASEAVTGCAIKPGKYCPKKAYTRSSRGRRSAAPSPSGGGTLQISKIRITPMTTSIV